MQAQGGRQRARVAARVAAEEVLVVGACGEVKLQTHERQLSTERVDVEGCGRGERGRGGGLQESERTEVV